MGGEDISMVCGKCGNKIEESMRFCSVCGSPTPAPLINDKAKAPGISELEVGNFAKFSVADKDKATITFAGIQLDSSQVFRGMALLLLVSFFLPFYSISVVIFGNRTHLLTANGFRMTIGWDYASGTFVGLFLFLIPIAIFVLFQFRKEINRVADFTKGMLFMAASGLSVLGLVLLFVAMERLSGPLISIRPSIGFFMSVLFYLVVAAVSVSFIITARKK